MALDNDVVVAVVVVVVAPGDPVSDARGFPAVRQEAVRVELGVVRGEVRCGCPRADEEALVCVRATMILRRLYTDLAHRNLRDVRRRYVRDTGVPWPPFARIDANTAIAAIDATAAYHAAAADGAVSMPPFLRCEECGSSKSFLPTAVGGGLVMCTCCGTLTSFSGRCC
jgi:hypothetical protein